MKEKITIIMTRKEFIDMGCVFAQAQNSDVEFVMIKDRKIRKLFTDSIKNRHRLWLKIQRMIK